MKVRKVIGRSSAVSLNLFFIALLPLTLNAGVSGYVKIPDIPGESKRADHEDEIDVHDVRWRIAQVNPVLGTGRTRARAIVEPLHISKYIDASSPYLALASMQGKSFDEIVLMVRKDSGEAHLDYLTITMTNVQIVSYEIMAAGDADQPTEEVAFLFEKVTYKYVVQEDDHSAGDEHEITYDIAAGV